jgi:cytochrome c5
MGQSDCNRNKEKGMNISEFLQNASFGLLLFSCGLFAETHHPEDFLKSIAGKPQAGRAIVEHFCSVCHSPNPQIQLGAPRQGMASDWQPRLKQGSRALFEHTDMGMGAMPPRGGCFECTDEQLKAAIDYLVAPKPNP